jgi:cytochrome c oxidase assembly protein subunit 11
VTPHKAAKYFNKIQCFCFEEQLLKSKQRMVMPVSFFIDPAMEDDPNLQDVDTITLSYTFYRIESEK